MIVGELAEEVLVLEKSPLATLIIGGMSGILFGFFSIMTYIFVSKKIYLIGEFCVIGDVELYTTSKLISNQEVEKLTDSKFSSLFSLPKYDEIKFFGFVETGKNTYVDHFLSCLISNFSSNFNSVIYICSSYEKLDEYTRNKFSKIENLTIISLMNSHDKLPQKDVYLTE